MAENGNWIRTLYGNGNVNEWLLDRKMGMAIATLEWEGIKIRRKKTHSCRPLACCGFTGSDVLTAECGRRSAECC